MISSILKNIKLKNNFIDVTISTDFENPSAATYNTIMFDTVINSREDKLTLENGKIRVGKGIKYVEVSGKIQIIGTNNATGGKNLVISVNNDFKERLMYYTDNSRNIDKSFTTKPLKVTEGDLISVAYYGAQNDVISKGGLFTHLYVKVI